MVKTDRPNIDFLLYTLSERPLSKLSENHKIYVIRPTVLKLWPNQRVLDDRLWYWDSFSCHNLKSMDPISTLLWFSESLERNLSNGIIKVHIWAIKLFANLATPWIIAHGPRLKNDKLWSQILTHHLKGFFLSFQKIIKLTLLDQRN